MPGHRGEDDNLLGSTITTTADARPPMGGCRVVPAGTGDRMYLTLYGSGLGLRTMRDLVTVRMAGLEAPVLYAGPAPGLQPYDQVNVQLPASPGRGRIEVTVEVNGRPANSVSVVFE